MKIEQRLFSPRDGWSTYASNLEGKSPQLVLAFGGRLLLEQTKPLDELRAAYPDARLVFASTSGEITGIEVTEDHLAVTAIAFEDTRIACQSIEIPGPAESQAAGQELARRLQSPDLVHIFVVSDGGRVNGTDLARGFNETLPPGVTLTGGLAGDGTRFSRTLVGLDCTPDSGRIVAVGFYGQRLRIGFGSSGGWSPFGPERLVTRATGNTLFELDGRSALALYQTYLGDQAKELPGSALRFPLALTPTDGGMTVVRTILSIDESTGSMVFAGDIPVGAHVRFMRAAYEELVEGAGRAAEASRQSTPAELAICVSCVGRRIVMGQRIEEETEHVREILGETAILTGFYSYGELAPAGQNVGCQLHNQTMTITTLTEV